jgi:hypothetical protein
VTLALSTAGTIAGAETPDFTPIYKTNGLYEADIAGVAGGMTLRQIQEQLSDHHYSALSDDRFEDIISGAPAIARYKNKDPNHRWEDTMTLFSPDTQGGTLSSSTEITEIVFSREFAKPYPTMAELQKFLTTRFGPAFKCTDGSTKLASYRFYDPAGELAAVPQLYCPNRSQTTNFQKVLMAQKFPRSVSYDLTATVDGKSVTRLVVMMEHTWNLMRGKSLSAGPVADQKSPTDGL